MICITSSGNISENFRFQDIYPDLFLYRGDTSPGAGGSGLHAVTVKKNTR